MLNEDVWQVLSNKNQLFVGLSGGLDSCVLLHILAQNYHLKPKIIAIHVNHGLSKNADSWQVFCERFCEDLKIPIIIKNLKLTLSNNQEAVARIRRYQAFSEHINSSDVLLLGHHEQDQAETFLLNLLRGSGIDGLGAMKLERKLFGYLIMRPLLQVAKKDLKQYALMHKLEHIEDESNLLEKYSRNYIRHKILPALQEKWPNAISQLAFATEDMQRAQANLFDLACIDYPYLINKIDYLDLSVLKISKSRLENIIWHWLKIHAIAPLSANIIERIRDLAYNQHADYRKVLLQQHAVIKYKDKLYLKPLKTLEINQTTYSWQNFPADFVLPNQLGVLMAVVADIGAVFSKNSSIEIRFNEKNAKILWHKQTKTLKKLWQTWSIPTWQRAFIPLIYVNSELAVIVGYAISDKFYSGSDNVQKFNFSCKR